jgi:hypothetical protein
MILVADAEIRIGKPVHPEDSPSLLAFHAASFLDWYLGAPFDRGFSSLLVNISI